MNESEIKVYPNPASNELTVEFFCLKESNIVINIIDMNGRVVKQIRSQISKDVNKTSLSIAELKAGMYTLSINNLSKPFQKY